MTRDVPYPPGTLCFVTTTNTVGEKRGFYLWRFVVCGNGAFWDNVSKADGQKEEVLYQEVSRKSLPNGNIEIIGWPVSWMRPVSERVNQSMHFDEWDSEVISRNRNANRKAKK